jgi:hypothetical protein
VHASILCFVSTRKNLHQNHIALAKTRDLVTEGVLIHARHFAAHQHPHFFGCARAFIGAFIVEERQHTLYISMINIGHNHKYII